MDGIDERDGKLSLDVDGDDEEADVRDDAS